MRSAGFTVEVIPNQGRGAAKARIEAARRLFPAIWFNEATTEAGRDALGWYHERKSDDVRDVGLGPEHDWASHGCFVGETEVLTRYGTCPFMDLPETGEILTPCGWKQYILPRITRKNASLVEVAFTGGHTVRCTPDHLFLTENGWKSASSLRMGMPIQSTLIPLPSTSTAVSTGCGRASVIWRKAAQDFIATFGGWLSARFQLVATSIIGMATSSITGSQISNVYPRAITSPSSEMATERTSLVHLRRLMPFSALLNGIDLKRGGYGTGGMLSEGKVGLSGSGKQRCVPNAVLNSWHCFARPVMPRFIVRLLAKLRPTESGAASGPLIIASVRRLNETADVWDITVPGPACFSLANGAVVHNSDAFGLMAVAYETPRGRPKPIKYPAMGFV